MHGLKRRQSGTPWPRASLRWGGLLLSLCLVGCGERLQEPEQSASPLRARLLTGEQYTNTIADTFGEDIARAVAPPLPPLARTNGLLASGAASVGITSDQIHQIQQAAASIAAKVVDEEHREFLLPCRPIVAAEADAACAAEVLRTVGRLLYRRPVSEARVSDLEQVASAAATELDDFYTGLALALEAMLISPEFLFVVDVAEPNPARPGVERLDAYSLASRLSFFLWNAPPDAELLGAAESGELHTEQGLRAQVDRLLASVRLEDGMRAFFDDMMAFDEFDTLAKDASVYPMVTGATLADAREQTLKTVIEHVVNQRRDYRDLFTTRESFMSMNLGPVYGVPVAGGWVRHEFPEDGPRLGLLTHVSFLAAHSHAVRSSPTLRGRALRELFLCQKVPDAPPNVDFSALEEAGDVPTARERLQVHNENPSCAGCHLITDPIGLALENFDGAGRYRDTENGAVLDISGELDGAVYDTVAGLAFAMRDHPKLSSCLVNRLYSYGTGGPVTLKYDRDILSYFTARFAEQGYAVPDLLRDIVLSDAFVTVRPEAPPADIVAAKAAAARQ